MSTPTLWCAHGKRLDGLIYASSMVMLDSARRKVPVPALARWFLGLAKVAHGLGHGLIDAAGR
jgi:hypothetical protein